MKTLKSFLPVVFIFTLIFALTLPLFTVGAATLIDDIFADGNSTVQNLPNNSLAIYKARSATVRTDAVGSVEYNMTATGTGSEAFWAYFTNSGAPVNLGVGDAITFSGTFSLQGFANNGSDIRFGLFNSNGSRVTADKTSGQSDANFADDTGYGAQFYASGTGSPFSLYRKDASPTTNIFNSMGTTSGGIATGWSPLTGTGATARQALVNDTPYTFTYSVSRTSATQTRVTISVTGGALSNLNFTATETSNTPNTSFDWFSMRVAGTNFATKMTFTRFLVDYSPAAPVITTQPQPSSQTVAVGSEVSYSVGASGNGLSYQWRKNGTPITGNASATTATLQLTNVQETDTGGYDVVVTNTGGSVTSDAVALTVSNSPTEPAPVITGQPQDTTVTVGNPTQLSVTAVGGGLSYQWFKNGVLITGATNSTLNFPSAQISDAANYTVRVSGAGGTINSNPARLTVVSGMSATIVAPASGTTNVCADTPLSITFNQAPRVGNTGRIRVYKADGTLVDTIDMGAGSQSRNRGGFNFNYYPIIINGNTASIYLHTQLAYSQTYYVTVEPGVIKDAADAPFAGFSDPNTLRFTTKPAAPAAGSNRLTVAANGTGDFCTVQGAIDFIPAANSQRVVVTVKNGTYTEIVYVPSTKPLVTVRGESRNGAVIQYPNNNTLNPSTQGRAMFGVESADFNLENITLHNTTPQGGSQAEALRTNGLRATIIKVNLKSFQDTLLTSKSAFVTDSYIEGDVDFMWGNGATFFRNTEIKALRENLGYYTQIRNGAGAYGNVYVNCRLTRGAGVTNGSFLSRIDPDDFPYSQVVFIDSQMDSHIRPVGWQFDNPTSPVTTENYPNIRFWEYNTTDLNGNPADCSQRHPISRNTCNNPLTPAEADFYRNPANVAGFTPQEKLTALVTLSSSALTYDGTAKSATATTDSAGLNVTFTYNGSNAAPVNAGTYTVVATINDVNYQGSATGTLVINPASATVALGSMNHVFDGNAKEATVITSPAGLAATMTYNGSSTPPVNPGSYTVVANVSDANYTGTINGILTINPNRPKAFPGAEGYGAYALGGRNGDTYHVTNLNDSGVGSLREGIRTAPARGRTIVFDVSGTIYLQSRLNINKPNLTLAGQTAPGDGITVAGETTVINNTHDIVVRYMRFRAGDIRCPNGFEGDSLWIDGSTDVIIDHVSASWSVDETLSVTSSNRVTVQWSLITESLRQSCHSNGNGGTEPHGYGSLLRYGNGTMTFHHNLYAHHSNRNPRIGDNLSVDFVNNVVYNWSINPGYTAGAEEGSPHINYTNNYSIAGPSTPAGSARNRAFTGGSVNTLIHQSGNFIDSDVDGVRDGANTGWAMFVGSYTPQATRFDFPAVNTDDAPTAYNRVLSGAGSFNNSQSVHSLAAVSRDAVDARILNNVAGDTGNFINSQNEVGGYPVLNSLPAPTDTDQDGIPDTWENQNGLNPNDPADASIIVGNGLTNLENYLNSLVQSSAPTSASVTVGGRVETATGRGISMAFVTFTATNGETRTALTNPFGYYRFTDLAVGETYVFSVSSKRYKFENDSQVINLTEARNDVNFVSNR